MDDASLPGCRSTSAADPRGHRSTDPTIAAAITTSDLSTDDQTPTPTDNHVACGTHLDDAAGD